MKIKFWIDADDEVIELDDDVTEEDIEMEFESWFNGCVSCGWYIEEDDQVNNCSPFGRQFRFNEVKW